MRILWVQQWAVLPVIIEDRDMVEENVQRGRLGFEGQQVDPSARKRLGESEGPVSAQNVTSQQFGAKAQRQPSGSQLTNIPGHNVPAYQMARGQSPSTYNMSSLSGALPEYQASTPGQLSHHDQQRFLAGNPSNISAYQSQLSPGQPSNHSTHSTQISSSYHQGLGPIQQGSQTHPTTNNSSHPSFGGAYFPSQQPQFLYYPGQYGQPVPPQHGSYPPSYGMGGYPQHGPDMSTVAGRVAHGGFSPGALPQYAYGPGGQFLRPGSMPAQNRQGSNSSAGSIPSTPRGPPRKPKQSGHALWVGNLPAGTVISDLKDHFSKDATRDIESVFLISKSNCAFVNYRSEAACAAAMTRFHDSRFQGVRLVCRLRRSGTATSSPAIPTGPAALMPSVAYTQTAFESIQQNREVSSRAEEATSAELSRTGDPRAKVPDRYFVMKSLTVEDMDLSVRNKIWATQSHNEEGLNKAYHNSENVYLIFSANKSGEYFGVARMASPITDEAAAELDWAPRGEAVIDDPDIPRSIPTAATESAPKGRIIDDSARGTIFWEADPEDEDLAPILDHELDNPDDFEKAEERAQDAEEAGLSSEIQAFGKPFRIEWISTERLPFYRTRGLRNPWNANREVKIARDGTEIETNVGRRLIQMFQKPLSS